MCSSSLIESIILVVIVFIRPIMLTTIVHLYFSSMSFEQIRCRLLYFYFSKFLPFRCSIYIYIYTHTYISWKYCVALGSRSWVEQLYAGTTWRRGHYRGLWAVTGVVWYEIRRAEKAVAEVIRQPDASPRQMFAGSQLGCIKSIFGLNFNFSLGGL